MLKLSSRFLLNKNQKFKLNFMTKNFSSIAKVKFQKVAKDVKNYMLFLSENEIDKNNSEFIKFLNNEHPTRVKDIKKHKFGVLYPMKEVAFYSERLCLVTAVSDLEKLRTLTSKAFKSFSANKIDDLHIGFSPSLPLQHRRIILNSLIMTNYTFKIKGDVKEVEEGSLEVGEGGEGSNINNINEEDGSSVNPEHGNSLRKKTSPGVKEIIVDLQGDKTNLDHIDSLTLWVNLANATLYTRSLANQRPNVASCDYLEEIARTLIKNNKSDKEVEIEVIKGTKLADKGLNLLYNVGKSAESEPRIIILTYKGKPTEEKFTHAVVGKGITFDTGGLNLKPTNYIEDMYSDKHGACNALSIFKSAVEMQLSINLVCAIGAADNAIDGLSYKPSDIIKSHKGYTVEITNTDAEGRLVLADVLSYVQEQYHPENIIDLATLTGACMVALGNRTAGLFTNNSVLSSHLVKASEEVMEAVWHLPINNEHRDDLKSTFADIKNAGKDRYGGASKGAAFLEKFIEKGTNWVHLDIAGPSHAVSPYDCWSAGATGFGTQLVLKYLYNYAMNASDVVPNDYKNPLISANEQKPMQNIINPFSGLNKDFDINKLDCLDSTGYKFPDSPISNITNSNPPK